MNRVIVLVQDAKPGEAFSRDEFDVTEAAMAALDRCRGLGYVAAECLVADADLEVIQHRLVNMTASLLRIEETADGGRFLREDPG
jgi:hypothetical protein